MYSRLWFWCFVTIVGMSSTLLAEIVNTQGYYTPPQEQGCGQITSSYGCSSPSVDAGGWYDYWGSALAEPWESSYTTVRAGCEWRFWVYAYSEARVFLSSTFQPCWAYAHAEVSASSSCSYYTFDPQHYDRVAYVDDSMFVGPFQISDFGGGAGENADQGQAWFNAGEGVSAEHTAVAAAQVEFMGYDSAYAHACARAEVSLRELNP